MPAPNPEANAMAAVMTTIALLGRRTAVPRGYFEPVNSAQGTKARSTCMSMVLSAELDLAGRMTSLSGLRGKAHYKESRLRSKPWRRVGWTVLSSRS